MISSNSEKHTLHLIDDKGVKYPLKPLLFDSEEKLKFFF